MLHYIAYRGVVAGGNQTLYYHIEYGLIQVLGVGSERVVVVEPYNFHVRESQLRVGEHPCWIQLEDKSVSLK